jgi:hypothetical protein
VTLFCLGIAPASLTLGVRAFAHPGEPHARPGLPLAGEAFRIRRLFAPGGELGARLKKLFEWPGAEQAATGRNGA